MADIARERLQIDQTYCSGGSEWFVFTTSMGLATFLGLESEHHFFIVGIWSCRLHQSSARARVSLFGCNVKNRVDKKVDILLKNYNFIIKIGYLIRLIGAAYVTRTRDLRITNAMLYQLS